jgi:hypothetical protein
MRLTLAASLLAVATLTGCGAIQVVPLNPAPRPMPARPAAEVEMYTAQRPARPYIEVASLSAWNELVDVRARAGQLGCDALIVVDPPTATGTTGTSGTATCVAWIAPPGGPAPTAAAAPPSP